MSEKVREFVTEPHTFSAVRSTNQYQNRFTPNEAVSNSMLYNLGFEADRRNMALHVAVLLPYQLCLIASTLSAESDIPKFFQTVNSLAARELNQEQGQSSFFWRDKSFDYTPLLTIEDLIETVALTITKPVRDGLVDDPSDWCGISIMACEEGTVAIEATRPDFCSPRSTKPTTILVEFVDSQLLEQENVTREEFMNRVQERVDLKIAEYLACRPVQDVELEAAPVLTAEEQQNVDPLTYAAPIPRFTTASDVAFAEYHAHSPIHILREQQCAAFQRAYRLAFRAWQQATDKNSVNFPIGTYKMRVIHNVPCTAPYLLE